MRRYRRGKSHSIQHQADEAKWRKAISEGKDISCYKCIHAGEINKCEACINCWCFSNYIERVKIPKFAVYHWETVPTDYVGVFNTLIEAQVFKDMYDFDDEWLISEIDD